MLKAIGEFFDKHIKGPEAAQRKSAHDPLHLATAALLVEMMRMSGDVADNERARVLHALEAKFGLTPDETAELSRLAEAEAKQATDYYQFTSLIQSRLTMEEKERLIEHLWAVAYADGELHRYEEHLVRKIADLLYVSHKAFIAAKLRAKAGAS
ncbi:MAG TPA: TerB family tellurite resistance protein [Burkholderiales bacterium]|nr:TerB family tellurite resistance protein [Burkholderiales bacterium]